ncbi:hypothetical protein, partial [Streptomyces sp. NPDC031705]|uniref:hypothetical protein n=1 Tax=Streptomyces sp. NPDC031705 TaxID=3155729 RepID=UPI0033F2F034
AATAEAVAVVAAVAALRDGVEAGAGDGPVAGPAAAPDLVAVAKALRRSPAVLSLRARSGPSDHPESVTS